MSLFAAVVFLAALGSALYARTLFYPFQFDDLSHIVNNTFISDLKNMWPPLGTRYMVYLSFALNYHFGGLAPELFRFINIFIHISNSVLLFLLAVNIFRTPRLESSGLSGGPWAFLFAFTASAIFIAHPIQTQAVTYVTQRFASMAALFYLGALVLYLKWRLSAEKSRYIYYLAALLAVLLAQKTKETAFTLPAMIIIFELIFFEGRGLRQRAAWFAPFVLCMAVIPLSLGFEPTAGGMAGQIRGMQLEELSTLSRHDYFITQSRVIVRYLRLLVMPVGQSLIYDMKLSRSFLDLQVTASFMFLASILAASVWWIVRSRKNSGPWGLLAAFGVVWFFVTVSVESSVIPIKDIIFEHRVYLPAAGAAFTFTSFLVLLSRAAAGAMKARPERVFAALAFILLLPLGAAAYARNGVWRDDLTLWTDSVEKAPESPRAQYNLALVYHLKGDKERAIGHYLKAVSLDPQKEEALYNLAMLYQDSGNDAEAVRYFRRAVGLKPGKAQNHYNMGISCYRLRDLDCAASSFREAARLVPSDGNAWYNLAFTLQGAGDTDGAMDGYRRVLAISPGSADALFNLASLHAGRGEIEEARRGFKMALEARPDYPEAGAWLDRLKAR